MAGAESANVQVAAQLVLVAGVHADGVDGELKMLQLAVCREALE